MQNLGSVIAQLVPARWRRLIYAVVAAVLAVEEVLDASGVGVVPEATQVALFPVLGALAAALALTQTRDAE